MNFDGALDDLKVGKNDLDRSMHVQKEQYVTDDEVLEGDRKLLIYRVLIKKCENSKAVVESWKKRHNFDDLAFHRAVYDKINVRNREVQRL